MLAPSTGDPDIRRDNHPEHQPGAHDEERHEQSPCDTHDRLRIPQREVARARTARRDTVSPHTSAMMLGIEYRRRTNAIGGRGFLSCAAFFSRDNGKVIRWLVVGWGRTCRGSVTTNCLTSDRVRTTGDELLVAAVTRAGVVMRSRVIRRIVRI